MRIDRVAFAIVAGFAGPDRGPCTSTSGNTTSTYTYDNGQIASVASGSSNRVFRWDQGLPTGFDATTSSSRVF